MRRVVTVTLFILAVILGGSLLLFTVRSLLNSPFISPEVSVSPTIYPLPSGESNADLRSQASGGIFGYLTLDKEVSATAYRGQVFAVDTNGIISLYALRSPGMVQDTTRSFTVDLKKCGSVKLMVGDSDVTGNPQEFNKNIRIGTRMGFVCLNSDFNQDKISCSDFYSCAVFQTR